MREEDREGALSWIHSLDKPGSKFTLGKVLGYGDTAIVHQAKDSDGKSVAIKIQEENEDSIRMIHNEFLMLSQVCGGDSRFPSFFGAYRNTEEMPSQIWFVLELCEEGSVKDLLSRLQSQDRFLKEEIIAYILREVLHGLKDLHSSSLIHRDLKAANILINKNGEIKICDFGFVKGVGSPEGKCEEVIGSPYWMAPELVVADRHPQFAYDSRVDIWSLGIVGIELGDCEAPNSHVYPPQVLFQTVQNPPPTLRKPADWSQLYSDFVAECLEKNPDHRPWATELIDHTFINDNVLDREILIKGSLMEVLNEVRDVPLPQPTSEVTVKADKIKMGRTSAPQPMYRDDLATLYVVSEEVVMETLSQRFSQGQIYTFLGDILLIINPFHEYPIYGTEVANKYNHRARCDNAPHIYAVGDRAYQDMLHHQEIQNIILTGETGSGKTTAAKQLLWHITNMSATNKKMIERMLKVGTVMEAFGNASTIFNPNSTRHIQYFELTFTKTGKLSGGILWAYCLEKWRVTNCGRNQSNFHIFYYLMDALVATERIEKYHLDKGKNYEYLPPSPSHPPQSNTRKFQEVKEAFNILDFSLEEQETIVKILAAILLIGQIHFKGEDQTEIQNPEIVDKIGDLLGVDAKKLRWTFTNYCVVSGGESARGKNNFDEAEETRDSLARSLYSRLVDWIVNLINTKLSFTRLVFGDQNCLSILDFPGFECFAGENTLDQFLVNMTNEQMQFFYNQRVFIWEMQDYDKEELPRTGYNYHDNHELLDVVLSKPNGLLAFLDDETKSANNSHSRMLEQIHNKLETSFIKVADANTFTVFHYSGQVNYDARNFIERNKNFVSPEVIQVLRSSGIPTVVQLFSNQMTKTGNLTISDEDVKSARWTSALSTKPNQQKGFNTKSRGKYSQSRQMQTIGATMRYSLLEMLQKASQGSAHFVRAFRSNLNSTPFTFDRDLIRYQLRALGIMDTIRARQLGYSRRLKFSEFLRLYKFLAFDFDEKVEETKDNCRLLLIRLKMEGWALGKTKVFLKYYNEEFLSRLYEDQVHKVVKIQALMRAFLARKKTSKFPRLAELRKQASDAVSPEHELNLVKRMRETNRKGSPAPAEKSSGYTPVYSSSRVGGVKAPLGKPLRQSLSPSDSSEDRPPSPRDIAKTFEARTAIEDNRKQLPGKLKSNPSPIPTPTPLSRFMKESLKGSGEIQNFQRPQRNLPQSPSYSPVIINPLTEFTNYANSMMSPDHEEPGPFNFQGLLKKTNSNLKQFGSLEEEKRIPPGIKPSQSVVLKSIDLNQKLRDKKLISNEIISDKRGNEESPMRHCVSIPYPLPGMRQSNGSSSKLSSNNYDKQDKSLSAKRNTLNEMEPINLPPGLVFEGLEQYL